MRLKHLFLFKKFKMASWCVSLNLSMWKRSKTHLVAERKSSALTSAMLDRRMTELTDHRGLCSVRAGLAVIAQKIQLVDQWCSGAVRQGSQAHETAGNRTYHALWIPKSLAPFLPDFQVAIFRKFAITSSKKFFYSVKQPFTEFEIAVDTITCIHD